VISPRLTIGVGRGTPRKQQRKEESNKEVKEKKTRKIGYKKKRKQTTSKQPSAKTKEATKQLGKKWQEF
jgi:hypothetical protein